MARVIAPPPTAPTPGLTHTETVEVLEAEGPSRERLPTVTPTPPFLYAYRADRYTVMVDQNGAAHVVPELMRVDIRSGVEGVTRGPGGRPVLGQLRSRMYDRGFTLLEPSSSYLRRTRVKGGWHHHPVFAMPKPGTADVEVDVVGYVRWLDSIQPQLPPPEGWAIRKIRSRLLSRARGLEERAQFSSSRASQLARVKLELAAVDAFLEKIGESEFSASTEAVDLDDLVDDSDPPATTKAAPRKKAAPPSKDKET